MSAQTDFINAIMQDTILNDEPIDDIFIGTPGLEWFLKNRETQMGGTNCEWIFYDTDPQQGQTIDPFDDYLVAPVDDELKASVTWAHYLFPFVLSKVRMKEISGPEAHIKYLQSCLKKTRKSARQQLSVDSFGTGQHYAHPIFGAAKTVKPMLGLDLIIDQNRTYAGFDSSTAYPQLDAYVKDNAAASYQDMYEAGTNGFIMDDMEQVMTETDFDDGEVIDYIMCNKATFGAIKRAAFRGAHGTVTAAPGGLRLDGGEYEQMIARAGIKSFFWEGVEVVSDGNCKADEMYFCNSNSLYMMVLEGRDMNYVPIEPNSDGDAMIGSFEFSAQIICEEPRRQGVITTLMPRS